MGRRIVKQGLMGRRIVKQGLMGRSGDEAHLDVPDSSPPSDH